MMFSKTLRNKAPSLIARQCFHRAGFNKANSLSSCVIHLSSRGGIISYPTNVGNMRYFSASPVDEDFEATNAQRTKSIEEQYSRKTPLEHVLLRPGMYVGPVERLPRSNCWVLDPLPEPYDFSSQMEESEESFSTKQSFRMTNKEYGLVPALIKIFDEILVNATDNRLRDPNNCTKLDVRIDPGSVDREPRIRIWNNGKGIPIHIHTEENMYVPEMLFGHLLTGSNFDDDEKRLTGKQVMEKNSKSGVLLKMALICFFVFPRRSSWIWCQVDKYIFQIIFHRNGRL